MKIVNTLQHYVKFGYKTFVVDNYVLEEPSEFDEVLKGEYVYKNGKLFKALKNTISKDENLRDTSIFVEISVYSDETPKSKEKKVNEISKNLQNVETIEDAKTEIAKDSQDEKTEHVVQEVQTTQKVNNFKTKKKR